MVFNTYTEAEKFVTANLKKAHKELSIKDWFPKWFIDDANENSSIKDDDKIRLFIYSTVMGINKSWLKNTDSREEVCFELWYYARIMYQVHETVSSHSALGSINDVETVKLWESELCNAKEYRREDIIDERATDIDANAFALYMMSKFYPTCFHMVSERICGEVKAKLSELYGLNI